MLDRPAARQEVHEREGTRIRGRDTEKRRFVDDLGKKEERVGRASSVGQRKRRRLRRGPLLLPPLLCANSRPLARPQLYPFDVRKREANNISVGEKTPSVEHRGRQNRQLQQATVRGVVGHIAVFFAAFGTVTDYSLFFSLPPPLRRSGS